jgi:hypothetical protein
MSTRSNIIIKDDYNSLYFYRHSDGYPECTLDDLKEFSKGYNKHLRNSATQSAGWLIIHGHTDFKAQNYLDYNWKVGSYEPTNSLHSDIEYFYIIDLVRMVISAYEYDYNKENSLDAQNQEPIIEFDISEQLEIVNNYNKIATK